MELISERNVALLENGENNNFHEINMEWLKY